MPTCRGNLPCFPTRAHGPSGLSVQVSPSSFIGYLSTSPYTQTEALRPPGLGAAQLPSPVPQFPGSDQ